MMTSPTPAERLIVALDLRSDADRLMRTLHDEAGVSFFKIGVSSLLDSGSHSLCRFLTMNGRSLMLDLKAWDTPDTVRRTVDQAFDLGARFVTVKADIEVVDAALSAYYNDMDADSLQRILVVGNLTSRPQQENDIGLYLDATKGGGMPSVRPSPHAQAAPEGHTGHARDQTERHAA